MLSVTMNSGVGTESIGTLGCRVVSEDTNAVLVNNGGDSVE